MEIRFEGHPSTPQNNGELASLNTTSIMVSLAFKLFPVRT